ncbi:MAG: GNAT family protein [Flavobacteriales bacterium]|nr:GNAT family N-acetyltransferase [Flavobacteriales bacterium]
MSDSVIIEPIVKDDHKGLFRMIEEDRMRLSTYFPVTCTRCSDPGSTRRYIKEIIARTAKRELFCFAMRDYEGGEPIGLIFLKEFDWSIPKCETAYFVSSIYEKRGVTTLGLMWTTDFAFTQLGVEKVYARIVPDNIASIKVAENCGYQRDGLLRRDFRTNDGELMDVYHYSCLR